MKRFKNAACLLLFVALFFCGCSGQEETGDGGEYNLVGAVQEINDSFVLLEVEQGVPGMLEPGETVAIQKTDMEEQAPSEFSALEVGDRICVTYVRISEEGPPPVLFAVGWSSDFVEN